MVKLVPYEPAFDEAIRQLFSLPVAGNIQLSLNRDPSYITGAKVQTEQPEIYLALDGNQVVGVFNMGNKRVFLNGEVRSVPYLCDLRIHPDYQNSPLFLRMVRLMGQRFGEMAKCPALTALFADNKKMMAMIQRRQKIVPKGVLPYYHPIADLVTCLVPGRAIPRVEDKNIQIRKAQAADVPEMQALQETEGAGQNYHPYYDFGEIGKGDFFAGLELGNYYLAFKEGLLVGILGSWDQSHFKQTYIRGYGQWISFLRPAYNASLARYFGFPTLPAVGERLVSISLHTVIVQDRCQKVFVALLNGLDTDKPLLITLDSRDPYCRYFSRIRTKISKKGVLYLVDFSPELDQKYKADVYFMDAGRI